MKKSASLFISIDSVTELFNQVHSNAMKYSKNEKLTFHTAQGVVWQYGSGKDKNEPSQIRNVVFTKLKKDLASLKQTDKIENNQTQILVNELTESLPFEAEFNSAYLNKLLSNSSDDDISISIKYLKIYSLFLDFIDFDEFLTVFNIHTEKKVSIPKKEHIGDELPDDGLTIDSYLFGLYTGLYFRPGSDADFGNGVLKMVLLLSPENGNKVFIRTLISEKTKAKFYDGEVIRPNPKVLKLEFGIERRKDEKPFSFSIHLDISHHSASLHNAPMKGVYSGADSFSELPIAGRIYLTKTLSWEDFNMEANNTGKTSIEYFGEESKFKPALLKGDDAHKALKPKAGPEIYKFFIEDNLYLENIKFIEQFSFDKLDELPKSYQLFSLRSNGKYIDISPVLITNTGQVYINGRLDDGNPRIYQGVVKLLNKDRMAILASIENDYEEEAYYLFSIHAQNNETVTIFNGTRVMSTLDDDRRVPFAGRVFLVSAEDFYTPQMSMKSISLFPKNDNEYNDLEDFKRDYKDIHKVLLGVQNNVIRAFSDKRVKGGLNRDIIYADLFLMAIKYYLQHPPVKKEYLIKLLYYMNLQGVNCIDELNSDILTAIGFDNDTYKENGIEVYELKGKKYFSVKMPV
jgi:hypothetical protein